MQENDEPENANRPGTGQRDPVELLAAEFLEKRRRGECPTVAEYEAAHPDVAEQIGELFPAMEILERLKVRSERTSDGRATLAGVQLEQLGDFRILREIGRGGMGIVYEAEQESLGRHVAVKVLPRQSLLDANHLKRFQREAQMTAKLHHTNIVPVFGVGQQDGYHYYVMQFIRGIGLDAVIRDLRKGEATLPVDVAREFVGEAENGDSGSVSPRSPTTLRVPREDAASESPSDAQEPRPDDDAGRAAAVSVLPVVGAAYWRSVAAIGVQVARALEYAHAQGTLHRDIKPANLLLDARGVAWVTDFGLAKAMGLEDGTQTGDIVGTLRYMAPEQFSGQADVRSDIYSLGLSLYELLTLEPAYADTQRSSLIRKITHSEPVRPRKLRPAIPRDLETIVLKAISRDPAHRYPSAGDLAGDLECYLEDRPIRAKRTRAVERLWRWARRNRAVASLAGTALFLLVLVAVIASAGYMHTRKVMEEESRQRKRAEVTSELAQEALDKIFDRFAPGRTVLSSDLTVEGETGEEIEVPVQPVLSKEAAMLLEQMLDFYRRLAEQGGDDAALAAKVADSNRRVGDIHRRLGDLEAARAAYLRALRIYEKLDASPEGDSMLCVEIARIYNELELLSDEKPPGNGASRKALAVLQLARPDASASPGYRFELARTYYLLGRFNAPGMSGPRLQGRAVKGSPPPPERGREPGGGKRGMRDRRLMHGPRYGMRYSVRRGVGMQRLGAVPPGMRRRKGDGYLRKAIDLLETLVKEHPSVPDYRHLLAQAYRELRPWWTRPFGAPAESPGEGPGEGPGERPGENDSMAKATRILQRLVEDFPDVPDYRYDLSETYSRVPFPGPTASASDYAPVRTLLTKALGIARDLVAERPNVPDYVTLEVRILHKLAEARRRAGETAAAAASLEKALDLQSALAGRFPDAISYQVWTAIIRQSLAGVYRDEGRTDEARVLLEKAVKSLNALAKARPGERHVRGLLMWTRLELSELSGSRSG